MPLPPPLETLWNEMQSVRAGIVKEVEGCSQAQADWRPGDADWSAGEIIHHLLLAEVGTGKLTSKLLKEAGPGLAAYPADLTALRPLPSRVAGPTEAPPGVRPESGHPIGQLVADFKAARERSRQSFERLAASDDLGTAADRASLAASAQTLTERRHPSPDGAQRRRLA